MGEEEDLAIDFTPEVLQRIIDRCNARIADTNDFPVICDGHSEEGKPEPPVMGYADNFRMGDIGKLTPRKCIYCDMHIRKKFAERAKELSRRSIELWVHDLTADSVVLERSPIDAISLLGGTRPARDLGLQFSKSLEGKSRYELKDQMDEAQLKQILEAVMQLPCMVWCNEQMQKEQAPEEAAPEGFEEEDPLKPKAEDKPADELDPREPREAKFEEQEEEPEPGKEKLRMQFDQAKRRYAKLESDHKELFAKVASLERRERRADRRAELMQLEGEGFVFDLADELETVQDLEPTKFKKHLAGIRKNYKKAPVGVRLHPAPVPEEGGSFTPAQKTPHEVLIEASRIANDKYNKR